METDNSQQMDHNKFLFIPAMQFNELEIGVTRYFNRVVFAVLHGVFHFLTKV